MHSKTKTYSIRVEREIAAMTTPNPHLIGWTYIIPVNIPEVFIKSITFDVELWEVDAGRHLRIPLEENVDSRFILRVGVGLVPPAVQNNKLFQLVYGATVVNNGTFIEFYKPAQKFFSGMFASGNTGVYFLYSAYNSSVVNIFHSVSVVLEVDEHYR